MGYSILVIESKVQISRDLQSKALASIKDWLSSKRTLNNDFSLAFVDVKNLEQADSLLDALETMRWISEVDGNGNIISLDFLGEKLGDDLSLFNIIAPYIIEGSYITFIMDNGEEPKIWRYFFKDEKVKEQQGKIVFSDDS